MEDNEDKFSILATSDECILKLDLSEEIISISQKYVRNYSKADDTLNKDIENSVLRYIGRLLTIKPATEKQIYRIRQICNELDIDVPEDVLEDKNKAFAFLQKHIEEK